MQSKFESGNKFLQLKVAVQEFLLSKGLLLERLATATDYEIDAFQLFTLVEDHGGFEEITERGLWNEIGLVAVKHAEPNCGIVCYEFYKSTFQKMQQQLIKAGILKSEGSINYDVQLHPLTDNTKQYITQNKKRELEVQNQRHNSQISEAKKRRVQKPKDLNLKNAIDAQDVFGASSEDDAPHEKYKQKKQPIQQTESSHDVKMVFGDEETNAKKSIIAHKSATNLRKVSDVFGVSSDDYANGRTKTAKTNKNKNVQDVFGSSTDDDKQISTRKQVDSSKRVKQNKHTKQNFHDVFGTSTDDEQKQAEPEKKTTNKIVKQVVGNKRKKLAAIQEIVLEETDVKDAFGESSDDDTNNVQNQMDKFATKQDKINSEQQQEKNPSLTNSQSGLKTSVKQLQADDIFGVSSQQESESENQQEQKNQSLHQNLVSTTQQKQNICQQDLKEVFVVSEEEEGEKEMTPFQKSNQTQVKHQQQWLQQSQGEQCTSSDGFKSPRNSKKKLQKREKVRKNSQIFAITKVFQQQQDCKKSKMQKRRVKQKTSPSNPKNPVSQNPEQNEKRVINIDKTKFRQKIGSQEITHCDDDDVANVSSQDERENEKISNSSDFNQLNIDKKSVQDCNPWDIFGVSSQDEHQHSDATRKLQRAGKIGASISQQPDKCEIGDVFGASSEDEQDHPLKKTPPPPPRFNQQGEPPRQSNIGDVFGVSSQEEQEVQNRKSGRRRKQPTKQQRIQKVQQWQITLDQQNVHLSKTQNRKSSSKKKEFKSPICKKQAKEEIFGLSSQEDEQVEETPNMQACKIFGFSSQDEGARTVQNKSIQNTLNLKLPKSSPKSQKQSEFLEQSKIIPLDYTSQKQSSQKQQDVFSEDAGAHSSEDECVLNLRKARLNLNLHNKEIKLLRSNEEMKNFIEADDEDINVKIVSSFTINSQDHSQNQEIPTTKDLDFKSNLVSRVQNVNEDMNLDDNDVLNLDQFYNQDSDENDSEIQNQEDLHEDENPSILPTSVKDFIKDQLRNNETLEISNQIVEDKSNSKLDNPNGRCCVSIQVPRNLRFPSRSQVAAVAKKFGAVQWIDYGYTRHRIFVTYANEVIAREAVTKIVRPLERFLNLEEGTYKSSQIQPPDLKDRFKQKKNYQEQQHETRGSREKERKKSEFRERERKNRKSTHDEAAADAVRPTLTIHMDQIRESGLQPSISPDPVSLAPLHNQVLPVASPLPIPSRQHMYANVQTLYPPQFQPQVQPQPPPLPPHQIQNYTPLLPQQQMYHQPQVYHQQAPLQVQPAFQQLQIYSNLHQIVHQHQYQSHNMGYNINSQQSNLGLEQVNNNLTSNPSAVVVPSFDTNALQQLQQSLLKINNSGATTDNKVQDNVSQLAQDTFSLEKIPLQVQGAETIDIQNAGQQEEGRIFDSGYTTVERGNLPSKQMLEESGGIPGLGGEQESFDMQKETQAVVVEIPLDDKTEPNNNQDVHNSTIASNHESILSVRAEVYLQPTNDTASTQQQTIEIKKNIVSAQLDNTDKAISMKKNIQLQQTSLSTDRETNLNKTNESNCEIIDRSKDQDIEEIWSKKQCQEVDDDLIQEDVMDKLTAPPSNLLRTMLSSVEQKVEINDVQKKEADDSQYPPKNQQQQLPEPPKPAQVKSKLMALFGQL